MNWASALRQVADTHGRCPACGDSPLITDSQGIADLSYTLTARCHGSTERLTVDLGMMMRAAPDRIGDKVVGWMRDLFALDAFPDMMELLAYNRGRLPGRRR